MPWTAEDLARIDAAIASGEETFVSSDGRRVTLRSIVELKLAREIVAGDQEVLPDVEPPKRVRHYVEGESGW